MEAKNEICQLSENNLFLDLIRYRARITAQQTSKPKAEICDDIDGKVKETKIGDSSKNREDLRFNSHNTRNDDRAYPFPRRL